MTDKKFAWSRVAVEKAKILSKLRYSGAEVAEVLGTTRMSCLSRANRKKEFAFTGRLRGCNYSEKLFKARVAEARAASDHVTEKWIAAQDALSPPEPAPQPPTPQPAKPAKRRLLGLPETVTPESRMEKEFVNLNRVKFLAKPVDPPVRVDGGISILELAPRSCRWVLGDVNGVDTRYCGKKNRGLHKGGSSYCGQHERLAWRKVRKEKSPQNTETKDQSTEENISLPKKSLTDT